MNEIIKIKKKIKIVFNYNFRKCQKLDKINYLKNDINIK